LCLYLGEYERDDDYHSHAHRGYLRNMALLGVRGFVYCQPKFIGYRNPSTGQQCFLRQPSRVSFDLGWQQRLDRADDLGLDSYGYLFSIQHKF
jgi:hypothetical protein